MVDFLPKSRMVPLRKTRGTAQGTYSSESDANNWYVRADGSRQLSNNWNAGPYRITASSFVADSVTVRSQTQPPRRIELVFNDATSSLDFILHTS